MTIKITIPEHTIEMEVPGDIDIFVQIISLKEQNRRVNAIKLYRDTTESSLREAKEFVDNLDSSESKLFIEQLKETNPEYFL